MMNDTINGVFEGVMGVFLCRSVYLLWLHKTVRGVSFWSVFWPMLWGYWNLYYYPSLGQTWSFAGGLLVVAANTAWIILALVYMCRERRVIT
jgi:hypothetical protein